jgi:molecular chaperone DnaK (HSP70)
LDPIVGIDLGTTNSLVAICDAAGPRVLLDDFGRALLPSVVRYDADASGRVVATTVGAEAMSSPARDDASAPTIASSVTVSSVKRLIGRSAADAAGDAGYLPYRVLAGERGTAQVEIAPGASTTPEEVSALVLARLKKVAEDRLGQSVRKAVITVPAYFDDAQRQATRTAGRLAGLEVVRIVPEPTAAALAYGIGLARDAQRNRREVSHVVVYDLGGGTFDVSVLRLTPAESAGETDFYQVLATHGDTHLGGDDIDHLLLGRGLPSPRAPQVTTPDELAEARRVKHELAEHDHATFRAADGLPERRVTRAEFEALIEPLVKRTLRSCDQAIRDARAKGLPEGELADVIDAVILVGGSTRIPMVRDRVARFFGKQPYTAIDPDQAVALGASVQAAILAGTAKGSLLLDVIPLSLGLETVGGTVAKLIVRNSPVPARASEMFSTSVDNQTSIRLTVYQGEREMAADCRKLGELHVRGIPPMPAGLPQLEVTFLVDANGVLNVGAVERRSGKRATMQVVPNHGLTSDEVERIERDSLVNAREDMTRHRIADLISHSALDISAIARTLERVRHALEPEYADALAEQLAALRGIVEAAKRDWRSVDPNAFQRAKESLDRSSTRLHEVAIAQSLQAQLSEPPRPSSPPPTIGTRPKPDPKSGDAPA